MPGEAAAAIGAAIRRAREQRGLSQEGLAGLLGKSQSAISFWEAGRRTPDLEDLANLVTQLDLNIDELLAAPRQRQSAKVVLRAQAERLYRGEVAGALERFIEEAERQAAPPTKLWIANDSPLGAALELLAKAGVNQPPVPVKKLAIECGARVLEYPLTDGVSGVLLELDDGAVIGYRSGDNAVRQRFTIAHELGHHLLRHYDNFHIDPTRTAEDGHPPGYDWKDERAANDFAAQLLMPATWVSQYLKQLGPTKRLAQKFQVSQEAMSYRLVNLGLR
jgi:transcriptional regulator with XRE-family HTH domain